MSKEDYIPNEDFVKGVNILIFDDELDDGLNNKVSIKKVLEAPEGRAYGNNIKITSFGPDAFNEFLKGIYDVVIIDIRFPHLDGYALFMELKSNLHRLNKKPLIYAYCDLSGFDRLMIKNTIDANSLQGMITEDIERI